MTALQTCYRKVTGEFGAGGSKYDALGHRGADYQHVGREAILAYDDIEITSVNLGTGLGHSVGYRLLTIGGFAGNAHIWAGSLPSVGQRFSKGQTFAYAAGYDDVHGTLWTGPHIHTTRGFVSGYNCSVGIRPLVDPVPTITAAIASGTAGGGGIPIPNSVGDEEMIILAFQTTGSYNGKSLNGAVFALSSGGIKRFNATQWSGKAPQGGGDAMAGKYGGTQKVGDAEFSRHLDAWGITWDQAMKAFDTSSFVRSK